MHARARSESGYKHFHLGEIVTEEGDPHPRRQDHRRQTGTPRSRPRPQQTVEHYDNTGCVAAFVRAKDGNHGIWVSGAIRSDAPAEIVRDLMANPPSGDWRHVDGALELQGVLSVPIPGFPVPRTEVRLVAAGNVETVEAMVASGLGETPIGPRALMRKRDVLRAGFGRPSGTTGASAHAKRSAAPACERLCPYPGAPVACASSPSSD